VADDFEQIQAKEPSYPDPGNLQASACEVLRLRREDAQAGAVKDKAQHKHGHEGALEA
jgi:hypothetical protein